MTPGTLNLTAYRNVPFLEAIRFVGLDFTGGTFALQVRDYVAAEGSALLTLGNATAGTQGLSVVVTEEDGLDVSTLTIQIDEATIDALRPWPANGQKAKSGAVALRYDLIITATGLPKSRWLEGAFTIAEGVTV